jgi:Holliday junction resolvase RusA-like endonuclease
MKFAIIGKPQGKQRARVSTFGGYAKAYTPEETVAYENRIMYAFKQAVDGKISPYWEMPVIVQIRAFYGIPKSFSKRKKDEALNGILRPQTKPDIDNVVKVVCDALNSVAYKDDTQVIKVVAEKYYADEPRVEVEIDEYGGV